MTASQTIIYGLGRPEILVIHTVISTSVLLVWENRAHTTCQNTRQPMSRDYDNAQWYQWHCNKFINQQTAVLQTDTLLISQNLISYDCTRFWLPMWTQNRAFFHTNRNTPDPIPDQIATHFLKIQCVCVSTSVGGVKQMIYIPCVCVSTSVTQCVCVNKCGWCETNDLHSFPVWDCAHIAHAANQLLHHWDPFY